MNLTIRQPRRGEEPICRLLLPEAAAEAAGREFRLAVSDRPPYFLGAISWRRLPDRFCGLRVHVVPTARRRRIGTQLLEAAVREAKARGAASLTGDAELDREPDAAPFLASRQFACGGRLDAYALDMAPLLAFCTRWRKRRGSVPAGTRVVRLAELPLEVAADLHARYVAESELPVALLQALLARGGYQESRVLLIAGQVEGMMLGSVDGEVATMASWAVRPQWRHGWATLHLLDETVRAGWAMGVRRLHFHASDRALATHGLARRFRATLVSRRQDYRLPITGA